MLSKQKDITWVGVRGYGALSSRASMKLVCALADRVVSCTRVMEAQINQQFHPKRSAAVYNPCDIQEIRALSQCSTAPEFDAFFAQPGKIVASMGREHDVKGFWHLIKAAALVRNKMPELNLRLMIIGEGRYEAYRKLAGELGMEEAVLFTGVQSNPFALLRKADAYALTSQSEGFPNALIEAMAVGLPCVSVNCLTGPAEILHEAYEDCRDRHQTYFADYGILTGVFSGEKDLRAETVTAEERHFAELLVTLFTDEAVCQRYQAAARARAEAFGMERYLRAVRDLIQEDLS